MTKAPLPLDEETRLEALHRYHVLDTDDEEVYDNITRLATHICGVPISAVTLIDEDRQWFKSRVGLDERETSRDVSFCAHAILEPNIMSIHDMREDVRFADNPYVVSGPQIRFYAGAPLVTLEGNVLGALCVMDQKPRALLPEQIEALQALSRHVMCQMEMRHAVAGQSLILATLEQARQEAETANVEAVQTYQQARSQAVTYIFETIPDKAYLSSDAALARFYGYQTFEELMALLTDI